MKSLCIIFLNLAFALSTHAKKPIQEIAIAQNHFQIFESATPLETPQVLSTMMKVIAKSTGILSVPNNLVIRLRSGVLEGADSTGYMTYDPSWLKINPLLEPVFIHELGHLIFQNLENLKSVVPEDSDYITYIHEQIELRQKLESLPPDVSKSELEKIHSEIRALDFTYEDSPLIKMAKPYNEFFADLLAVLVTKDADAMTKVEKDSVRSFNPMTPMPSNYLDKRDVHTFVFTSRQFVWQIYQHQGMTEQSAKLIVETVYNTIWKEMKQRESEDLTELRKAEIDARLLEQLQQAFNFKN